MKRISANVPVGSTQRRYKVKLESDDCTPGTIECRFLQFDLIKRIAEMPDLTTCGTKDFERLLVYHNGKCWVAEAESIVEVPNAETSSNTT
jgi:hypothetical protein